MAPSELNGLLSNYEEIRSTLRHLGLSDYEARAYIALVVKGYGTAEDIAKIGGIPRTSSYKVLESLVSRKLAQLTESRPAVFHAISPLEVRKIFVDEIDATFNVLERMQGVLTEKGMPQLVYTIMGREKILAKIGELLEVSTFRFFISTPSMPPIRKRFMQKFREAVNRGVEVIVVAEPSVKVPPCTIIFRRTGLIATDVICDGRKALIASPDYSICGYSDNPFLVEYLETFMMSPFGNKNPHRI